MSHINLNKYECYDLLHHTDSMCLISFCISPAKTNNKIENSQIKQREKKKLNLHGSNFQNLPSISKTTRKIIFREITKITNDEFRFRDSVKVTRQYYARKLFAARTSLLARSPGLLKKRSNLNRTANELIENKTNWISQFVR